MLGRSGRFGLSGRLGRSPIEGRPPSRPGRLGRTDGRSVPGRVPLPGRSPGNEGRVDGLSPGNEGRVDGIEGRVDGKDGLVIEDTPENLAEAIMLLVDNPELCQKMGRNARAKALDLFDLDKQATKVENIYTEVLSRQAEKNKNLSQT